MSLSQIHKDQLGALRARVARGLALPSSDLSGKRQTLGLAQDYLTKCEPSWPKALRVEGGKSLEELRSNILRSEAKAAAGRPQPAVPTTVGALRRLLAGIPDDTILADVPVFDRDPTFAARVARVLAMLPPTRQAGPSARLHANPSQFAYYNSPEALGL